MSQNEGNPNQGIDTKASSMTNETTKISKLAKSLDALIRAIIDDSAPMTIEKGVSLATAILLQVVASGLIALDRIKDSITVNLVLIATWGIVTALVTGSHALVSTNIRLMAIWCSATIFLLAAFRFACQDQPTPVILCTGIAILFLVPMHISRSHSAGNRKALLTIALWASNVVLIYFVYWR